LLASASVSVPASVSLSAQESVPVSVPPSAWVQV
jgi:hypothetical protein